MNWIAAGGGPIDGGAGCVRRGAECVKRGAERVRRWPRLKHVVAVVMVVTMRRFPSDRVARKADRQSDRSDKAFDHGSTLLIEKRRTSPGVCSNPHKPRALEGRKGRGSLASPAIIHPRDRCRAESIFRRGFHSFNGLRRHFRGFRRIAHPGAGRSTSVSGSRAVWMALRAPIDCLRPVSMTARMSAYCFAPHWERKPLVIFR
jgi:hypothetical protein